MTASGYDKIIIGAGLYGLYAAKYCAEKRQRVLVIECDNAPFMRASYINQARVHQGYHYPRSLSTAVKSAGYFERFNRDFDFCINGQFDQIYATSRQFSWTDGNQFKAFCEAAGIPCEELHPNRFFKERMCDGAFLTREYAYDADILKEYFMEEIGRLQNVELHFGEKINVIEQDGDKYLIETDRGSYSSGFVLNATYASTNQIQKLAGFDCFKIKYELCEIILCDVQEPLKDIGITVMDGPFFSIMPFGRTGLHSLTAVTFTPHAASYEQLPTFGCQEESKGFCSPEHLGNCNSCPAKPDTAFDYMAGLARKYLREEYGFSFREALFSMKPILVNSEIDDSRPTVVRVHSDRPYFISVLSGKINTLYDMDEVLDYD
ncbi:MAG: FAD-dependent oxidoreductase [Lachnospiraceae bacterium]|jgi:hypothetical protein